MVVFKRMQSLFTLSIVVIFTSSVWVALAHGKGKDTDKGKNGTVVTLETVKSRDWSEAHVRRVLAAFAYGGQPGDAQIQVWGNMKPDKAVAEILTFDTSNERLSPPDGGDDNAVHCDSLESLQAFWSGNEPGNIMRYADRGRYSVVNSKLDLSHRNLQNTWVKAITTRGCNPFLHKTVLMLTNYLASIHIRNVDSGLIRAYYDDYLSALAGGADFIELMTVGAQHAAVARHYGHKDNIIRSNGTPRVNDDFAREYFQLFFRILGVTEDPDYHEDVTIEHNAWLLTGMKLDKDTNAYGADHTRDWWISPIDFSDHTDSTGRRIRNLFFHHADCLEILNTQVCGATAAEKLEALGPVAANHPESLENVPVFIIGFFADDNLDEDKIEQIRGSWAGSGFNLLYFLQKYASSTAFHDPSTVKYFTAFDRNLLTQNANTLSNEENFAREFYDGPFNRMSKQGMEMFEPVRAVFGHQTGLDAVKNRYIFKDAYFQNVAVWNYLYDISDKYTLSANGSEFTWKKDWGSVIPVNASGEHVVSEVADWLWNRFIRDGGKNFDPIARAQVHALLARDRDLGYVVDRDNPEGVFTSADITSGAVAVIDQANSEQVMDLDKAAGNRRVGMAINFITMTPYAFAMEGE